MALARDLMTTQVTTVDPAMSLNELETVLLSAGVSGAPVVSDGSILGVVSGSDVMRVLVEETELAEEAVAEYYLELPFHGIAARSTIFKEIELVAQRMAELTVRNIMHTRVIAVAPADTALDVARRLLSYRIHRVLVTEENRLLGIISSLDLVQLLAEPSHVPAREPTGDEVVYFTPDLTGEQSELFPGDGEVIALREDAEGGATTLLVRLRPGGRIDTHAHPGPVQHFVLGGQYESEDRVFKAGTYRLLPKAQVAPITSRDGAVILVVCDAARS